MNEKWNRIIRSNKCIYIYGAGKYGKRIYSLLCLCGCSDRIKGFVVTSKGTKGDFLFNIPIIVYKAGIVSPSECMIILAVGEKNAGEVRLSIEENEFNSFIPVSQEEYIDSIDWIYDECVMEPIINARVLFSCYFGRGYTCNCKYIAEYIRRCYPQIDLFWEIDGSVDYELPEGIQAVQIDTPEYYRVWYTSKVIVSNNGLDNQKRKREGQFIIDTWHGIGPTKKMGVEAEYNLNKAQSVAFYSETYGMINLMTAASGLCVRNYRKSFLYSGEIMECGYPRNDIFFRSDKDVLRNSIRERLGVQWDDYMVLYAPTYRREQCFSDDIGKVNQKYDFNWERIAPSIEKKFKKKVRMAYRFHHITDRRLHIRDRYPDGIDVTDYPDMQELLLAADILITDYSSSMWDFSLQRKPVFLYYNDADEVEKEVGFYRHPDTYPYPKGHTTEELCQAIICFDDDKYQRDLDEWFNEYGTYDDGHASERVVERIMDVIDHP